MNPPTDDAISNRLVQLNEDNEDVVRKRFVDWKGLIHEMEETYGNLVHTVQSERTVEEMTDMLGDMISNPL